MPFVLSKGNRDLPQVCGVLTGLACRRRCSGVLSFLATCVITLAAVTPLSCGGPQSSLIPPADLEKKGSEKMVRVPQGSFTMGWDSGELNERPEHKVFLGAFLIDRYEVSAVQFADFLNVAGNPESVYFSEDQYSTIGTVREGDEVTYVPRDGHGGFPANNVSWYGADAYCRWLGKRLPSEAEWEKAARGDDKRIYPWGDEPPSARRARYGTDWHRDGFDAMVPVDALPEGVSFYGVYNMAGNVWEWTADWYRQNYCDFCGDFEGRDEVTSVLTGEDPSWAGQLFQTDTEVPPRRNPSGPETGSFKILRGGSWYDHDGDVLVRSTYRYWFMPEDLYLNTGFRCVR